MDKKHTIIVVVVAVVFGVGGFFGGVKYNEAHAAAKTTAAGTTGAAGTRAAGGFAGRGARGGGAGTAAAGGGFVTGQILNGDSNSITLQLPNNAGTKIVYYSSSTQISKMAVGSPADLAAGTTVIVTGTTNSDGSSLSAQSISIRPPVAAGQASSTPAQ